MCDLAHTERMFGILLCSEFLFICRKTSGIISQNLSIKILRILDACSERVSWVALVYGLRFVWDDTTCLQDRI